MIWPIVFTAHGVILEYYSACASKQISQVSQKKLREKSDDVSTTMQYLSANNEFHDDRMPL